MEREGIFKEDSVLCPRCNWRSTVGLRSPRRQRPTVEEQAPQPAATKKTQKKKSQMSIHPLQPIQPLWLQPIQPPQQQPIQPLQQQPINPLQQQPMQQPFQPPQQQPINPPQQQPMQQPFQPPQQQPTQNQTQSSGKKRKTPPTTTGRSKKVNRVKIKVRKRVKITRSQLYHVLQSEEQRNCIPKDIPNKYKFFGTVVSRGKGKSSWNVKFDVLPVNQNVVQNITRTKLIVVEDNEEEKALEPDDLLDEVEYISDNESPAKSRNKEVDDEFCKMDKDSILAAETYNMVWGKETSQVIQWKILREGVTFKLSESTFIMPESVGYHQNFTPDQLDNPTDFFFKFIFPDIIGKLLLSSNCSN